MKRYLKFFTGFSLIFLLSLALTGMVSAETIRGKGWLHAEGSGTATLHMTGRIEIKGHGVGLVYIYGAQEIQADGDGRRTNLAGDGVVFGDITEPLMLLGME